MLLRELDPHSTRGRREIAVRFQLSTSAFHNGVIPKNFSCEGEDVSPALVWTEAPAGTQSFALIADDPDAPAGTWVHWVLYDLPAGERGLPEGIAKDRQLPSGASQGKNDFGQIGYNGPCPPHGATHRYFFKLWALDSKTNLRAGASKADLEHAMKGHILGSTKLVGRFRR